MEKSESEYCSPVMKYKSAFIQINGNWQKKESLWNDTTNCVDEKNELILKKITIASFK